jgi:hypothetical protein
VLGTLRTQIYSLSYVLLNAGVDWGQCEADRPVADAAGSGPWKGQGPSSCGATSSSSSRPLQPWAAPWDCFVSPMPPRLRQLLENPVQVIGVSTITSSSSQSNHSSRRVLLPPGAL